MYLINILIQEIQRIFENYVKDNFETIDIAQCQALPIQIQKPRESSFGHLSSNICMVSAKLLKKAPRDIGNDLIEFVREIEFVESANIHQSGFINIFLNDMAFARIAFESLLLKDFGANLNGIKNHNKSINLEFLSVNPTGLLHVGHLRNAVYGDILGRLLKFNGYKVTQEYYINDFGNQIQILCNSIIYRFYKIHDIGYPEPKDLYKGDYIIDVAKALPRDLQDSLLATSKDSIPKELSNNIAKFAIDYMMQEIQYDLKQINISFDIFTSEKKLNQDNYVNTAIQKLQNQELVYEGILENAKEFQDTDQDVHNTSLNNPKQKLFASTKFGDDEDRVIQRSNGLFTYFAGDIGYALHKIERNYDQHIILLGEDHKGYITRLKAVYRGIQANCSIEVYTTNLVKLLSEGKIVKMSKRAGNFVTARDIIEAVGPDPIRFFMISRDRNSNLEFDLELAISKSKENPLYYVQYMTSRIASMRQKCRDEYLEIFKNYTKLHKQILALEKEVLDEISVADMDNLVQFIQYYSPEEKEIIVFLELFPTIIASAIENFALQKITQYLYDLATAFHAFWNLGKANSDYRLVSENSGATIARLLLCSMIEAVVSNAFEILGTKMVTKM